METRILLTVGLNEKNTPLLSQTLRLIERSGSSKISHRAYSDGIVAFTSIRNFDTLLATGNYENQNEAPVPTLRKIYDLLFVVEVICDEHCDPFIPPLLVE